MCEPLKKFHPVAQLWSKNTMFISQQPQDLGDSTFETATSVFQYYLHTLLF
jgi:hypothetical protein